MRAKIFLEVLAWSCFWFDRCLIVVAPLPDLLAIEFSVNMEIVEFLTMVRPIGRRSKTNFIDKNIEIKENES